MSEIHRLSEPMEMTFTVIDADMFKLREVLADIDVNACPWFEVQDKHGNRAKYYREPHWIPVTERLPENDNEVLITVWDAEDDYVEVYKGFYQGHEWWTQWCHGCSKIKDEPCGENIVIAWMPLPEPYRGGETE